MIDKYTIFNDLILADFYHILRILENKKAIQILNKDLLDTELLQLLEDAKEGD